MGLFHRKKESDNAVNPEPATIQVYRVEKREGLEDNLKKCQICNKESTKIIVDEVKGKVFVSCEEHKYEVYAMTGIVTSVEYAKTVLDVQEHFGFGEWETENS